MRRSLLVLLSSLFAFSLVLTACGDDGDTTHHTMGSTPAGDMPAGSMPGDMPGGMSGHMGGGSSADHPTTPVVPGARRIEVAATSFAFDPEEITVKVGEDVTIVLTSDDLLHDFTVDGLDAHVAADAGETAEGGLRADKPGRYTYSCTVDGHRKAGMQGTLVVEP
jgi:plastocyanin